MLLQIITMSVFSDNIRFLRGKKGITQQDLKEIGLKVNTRHKNVCTLGFYVKIINEKIIETHKIIYFENYFILNLLYAI